MTTGLYHTVISWLRDLIAGTQWEGHLYAVGGCCRDELLGLEIKDIDLAVDLPNGGVNFAKWLQRKRLVCGHPVFFYKFGTAKLRLRRFPEEEIEMVQTRREQYTKETSRCPEVCFGSIEDDCFRRDFTANSLYYNITTGQMTDITGKGIDDMKSGVLRTPMDPDETFNDDPVRILRGLRFANRFGWTIEPEAYRAMLAHIHRLTIVSRERCHSELCKMLNGPDPVAMMNTMRETGALGVMCPMWSPVIDSNKLWDDAVRRLRIILSNDPEAPTRFRLAAFMVELRPLPRESARLAREIMSGLRFDRPIVADVSFLVRFSKLDPAKLDNPRRVREVQNLAVIPQRFNLLLRFISDCGDPQRAEKLAALNNNVVASGHSGFAGERDEARRQRQTDTKPRKPRRRRHSRRHRPKERPKE